VICIDKHPEDGRINPTSPTSIDRAHRRTFTYCVYPGPPVFTFALGAMAMALAELLAPIAPNAHPLLPTKGRRHSVARIRFSAGAKSHDIASRADGPHSGVGEV
jgi:hypothetical protein